MSAINREILLDSRYLPKHLPDTPQVQRLLKRGQAAHVFNDEETMLRVAQTIIERGLYTGNIRNYERYGLLFSEAIGFRIDPTAQEFHSVMARLKSMQTTDTILSPALDPVKDSWSFLEVWVDPMQSPPYVLLLLGDKTGSCDVFDPADGYKLIKNCGNYEEAQLWLLEDEYEPLEGRLAGAEIHGLR